MTKVIRINNKGNISYNIESELYYVEFGSVHLALDFYQYKDLEDVVERLEVDNKVSNNDNRIRIPFESDNFTWVLTPSEVIDLKVLFGIIAQSAKELKLKTRYSVN